MQPRNRALLLGFGSSLVLLRSHAATSTHPSALLPPPPSTRTADASPAAETAVNSIERLERALVAAHRDPGLPQHAWDRALALEDLGLRQRAREAWRTYLELEPDSDQSRWVLHRLEESARFSPLGQWAIERRRLSALAERGDWGTIRAIVRRFPQAVREHAEENLFAAWADAHSSGAVQEAERTLDLVERLGAALLDETGDALVRDAASAIRAAAARPSQSRLLSHLVRGHQLYREGKRTYDRFEYDDALDSLEGAATELALGQSSFELLPSFFAGVIARRRGDLEGAAERWEELRADAAGRYPIFDAYVDWMFGVVREHQGRLGESLSHYRAALALFARTRQDQSVAQLHYLISEDLGLLGEHQEAWLHLHKAVSLREMVHKRSWHVTILENAAAASVRRGYPTAAGELVDEAVRIARLLKTSPSVLAEALVFRAGLAEQLADQAAAMRDLDEANALLPRISDSNFRVLVETELLTARAKLLRAHDAPGAIEALDAAIAGRSQAGADVVLAGLLFERALAKVALQRIDEAEQDLLASLAGYERDRRNLSDEKLRISYFDQARNAFDEMVRLQLDARRDPWRAWRFAERARARALLDAVDLDSTSADALDTHQLQERLPPQLVLVHYALLEKRMVVWVLTNRRAVAVQTPTSAQEVEHLVWRLLGVLESGATIAEVQRHAAPLYQRLVQPLRDLLPPGAQIVFVPDKALHYLPFSVLYDATAGRFLVELHPVAVAPSTTLLLHALERDRALRQSAGSRTLIVGNPTFDRTRFPHLPSLPGAALEAEAIARLYPQSDLLIGPSATKEQFLAAAGNSRVVHFAGHAVANEEYPFLSYLVFAANEGKGPDRVLTAHEIAQHEYPETQLVVLAGCKTARARTTPGEGVLNLARPFLAGGVPSVVAALWRVDDRGAATLLERFHSHLMQGASPVVALRNAQLELLGSSDPVSGAPQVWAAFELIR